MTSQKGDLNKLYIIKLSKTSKHLKFSFSSQNLLHLFDN